MKTKIEVALEPFILPDYVVAIAVGSGLIGKYHLKDIDPYDLDKLCEEFTKNVFEKAGKQRPPQVHLAP